MTLPKFVKLLNVGGRELDTTTAYLLDAPKDVALHYITEQGTRPQSRTCLKDFWRVRGLEPPRGTCKWCDEGKFPSRYFYVAVATWDQGKGWVPCLLQMTATFEDAYRSQLTRGRILRVTYRGKGIPVRIDLQDAIDPVTRKLPEPFEPDEALARMKLGYVPTVPPGAAVERGEDIIPFQRRRKMA